MRTLVGLGAGQHAKVVLDALRQNSDCKVIGLLDPISEAGIIEQHGLPVLGSDARLPQLRAEGVSHFFIGLGNDNALRARLFRYGLACGLEPISAIHPSAQISPSARLGLGITVMACAVINPDAEIADNVIINTGAIVEHDCLIGSHTHIAPGACLLGAVQVGEYVHVGARAVVRQGLRIGNGSLVGAGAVVVRDVLSDELVMGVPASPRTRTQKGGNG
ncbi:MAG TPA: acetyltransferase [Holophaga sp.]|nr:acetyltransferase [Holophaga sp.]